MNDPTAETHQTAFGNVRINFRSDWVSILKATIVSLGYEVDPAWDDTETSDVYFSIQRLLIFPIPREIQTSKEFSCPKEHVRGFEEIKRKARNGERLWPHQSKGIKNPRFKDKLLLDWGIHHLHLGEKLEYDGFVNRTGPVVFVRVDANTLYLIAVMDHGSRHEPWVKKTLLEIIHTNWPDSIAVCRLVDVEGIACNPAQEEIQGLRDANINYPFKAADGTLYVQLGSGFSCSPYSAEAIENTHRHFRFVARVEDHVKNHLAEFVAYAKERGKEMTKELHFRLMGIRKGYVEIQELHSNTHFKVEVLPD